MAEAPCGQTHLSFEDALRCAEARKRRSESFGSLREGVNLWWGDKDTANIKNRGYVIGLWNSATGDR
jgi:hypothetical protein